jgi:hypothetical protein
MSASEYDRACPNCKSFVRGIVVSQIRPLIFKLDAFDLPICTNPMVQRLWIAANIERQDQKKCIDSIPLPLNADFAGPVCRSRFWQELSRIPAGQKVKV